MATFKSVISATLPVTLKAQLVKTYLYKRGLISRPSYSEALDYVLTQYIKDEKLEILWENIWKKFSTHDFKNDELVIFISTELKEKEEEQKEKGSKKVVNK